MSMPLYQILENIEQRQQAAASSLSTGVVMVDPTGDGTAQVNVLGTLETALLPVDLFGVVKAYDTVIVGLTFGRPVILCRLAKAVAGTPTPQPVPPIGQPGSGVSYVVAQNSRTYVGGAWRTDAMTAVQGTSVGVANTGAWFYGTAPRSLLVGATITRLQIRLQRQLGGTVGAQPVHLYLTSDNTQPVGDTTRTAGPTDISMAPGDSLLADLPVAWGTQLASSTGGGIAIAGDPFLTIEGLATDPVSGQLEFTWMRSG